MGICDFDTLSRPNICCSCRLFWFLSPVLTNLCVVCCHPIQVPCVSSIWAWIPILLHWFWSRPVLSYKLPTFNVISVTPVQRRLPVAVWRVDYLPPFFGNVVPLWLLGRFSTQFFLLQFFGIVVLAPGGLPGRLSTRFCLLLILCDRVRMVTR